MVTKKETTKTVKKEEASAKKEVVQVEPKKAESVVKKTKAGPKSGAAQAKIAAKEAKKAAKHPKVGEPKPEHGKKYREAIKQIEADKRYPLEEAVALAVKTSPSKFDATVELHVRVSQEARGMITMSKETGKKMNIAIFSAELAEELKKGKITFDILVATPKDMPELAKYAKLLGPKGLMPNPKSGTVVDDPAAAKKELSGGKTEYRTDAGKNIHLVVGKCKTKSDDLLANITEALRVISSHQVQAITLATTMGPGVSVELPSA